MTLLERLAKCGRDDDPTQHDKPRQPVWVQKALAKKLPAKVWIGGAA